MYALVLRMPGSLPARNEAMKEKNWWAFSERSMRFLLGCIVLFLSLCDQKFEVAGPTIAPALATEDKEPMLRTVVEVLLSLNSCCMAPDESALYGGGAPGVPATTIQPTLSLFSSLLQLFFSVILQPQNSLEKRDS
jgi:hypothetical protein